MKYIVSFASKQLKTPEGHPHQRSFDFMKYVGPTNIPWYNSESTVKGYRLMALCSGVFAPSNEFVPYLEQHLEESLQQKLSKEVGK